jgi:broad specificity phosphatase PhoE
MSVKALASLDWTSAIGPCLVEVAVAIVFETHSITTDNEAGLATGWLDGRLSERGKVLAAELGQRRRHDGLAAVFASDLGRSVETVELAFGGSSIPVHLDVRLREVDYGAWNGMPVSRLERERVRRISRPFPGGESYQQVVTRVAGFLEELARDRDRGRVLLVGHTATRWALDTCWPATTSPRWWRRPSAGRKGGPTPCRRAGGDPARRLGQPTHSSSTVERSQRSSSLNSCRATARFKQRRVSRMLLPRRVAGWRRHGSEGRRAVGPARSCAAPG